MKFPIPFKQSLNSGSNKLQELLLHYKNKVLIFLGLCLQTVQL